MEILVSIICVVIIEFCMSIEVFLVHTLPLPLTTFQTLVIVDKFFREQERRRWSSLVLDYSLPLFFTTITNILYGF